VLPRQRQCHDGVAVPCPRGRPEFLLQRGKRKGNRLSEASFSFPPSATEISRGCRHLGRAFLC
jgi:hypothetical protein